MMDVSSHLSKYDDAWDEDGSPLDPEKDRSYKRNSLVKLIFKFNAVLLNAFLAGAPYEFVQLRMKPDI